MQIWMMISSPLKKLQKRFTKKVVNQKLRETVIKVETLHCSSVVLLGKYFFLYVTFFNFFNRCHKSA
jgi:hypothetical protein